MFCFASGHSGAVLVLQSHHRCSCSFVGSRPSLLTISRCEWARSSHESEWFLQWSSCLNCLSPLFLVSSSWFSAVSAASCAARPHCPGLWGRGLDTHCSPPKVYGAKPTAGCSVCPCDRQDLCPYVSAYESLLSLCSCWWPRGLLVGAVGYQQQRPGLWEDGSAFPGLSWASEVGKYFLFVFLSFLLHFPLRKCGTLWDAGLYKREHIVKTKLWTFGNG